jgi:hypothetical protein
VAAADPALLYRPSMRVEAGTLTNLEPTHGCEREVGGERERETEEHRKTAKQMTSRLRHQENEGCVVYKCTRITGTMLIFDFGPDDF